MTNDCVYVAHAGVFLVREPAPVTREEYLRKIAGQKTLLAQVRDKPDQSFAQAFEKVHNPIQDLGPMMLSLACDSRKFVAEREGRVLFDTYNKFDDPERPIPKQWQLIPRFRPRPGPADRAAPDRRLAAGPDDDGDGRRSVVPSVHLRRAGG